MPIKLLVSFAMVKGHSMYPTCVEGDLLIVSRLSPLTKGDIVTTLHQNSNDGVVKRLIGVEGDAVKITDGQVFVNDVLLQEPYIQEPWSGSSKEVIVGKNEVYLLGDNRNHSSDSRIFGCLSKNEVVGVVIINLTRLYGIRFKSLIFLILLIFIGIPYSIQKIRYAISTKDTTLNSGR